jgi:hypothetical protein
MLLTSVISGNKLGDLLSCIVVKPAYHNWKSQASQRFGFPNRFVSQADVKDNAAQPNSGGGIKNAKVLFNLSTQIYPVDGCRRSEHSGAARCGAVQRNGFQILRREELAGRDSGSP